MIGGRRIDFSLFDEELKQMVNASAKIFPIATFEDLPATKDKEYYQVLTGSHKGEIYFWDNETSSYILIGANDLRVDWGEVTGKPTMYPAADHSHQKADIIDFDHDHNSIYASITHDHDLAYAHLDHNHDGNYAALNHSHNLIYAPFDHNHDGAYLKKTDASTQFAGKADKDHSHPVEFTQVTDHERRINSIESGYSDGHYHSNLSILEKLDYTGTSLSVDLKVVDEVDIHIVDPNIHVDELSKARWDAKSDFSGQYSDLLGKPTIPSKVSQLSNDIGFITTSAISGKADKIYVDQQLTNKAESSTVNGHLSNVDVHVTQTDKINWNNKKNISVGNEPIVNNPGDFWYRTL